MVPYAFFKAYLTLPVFSQSPPTGFSGSNECSLIKMNLRFKLLLIFFHFYLSPIALEKNEKPKAYSLYCHGSIINYDVCLMICLSMHTNWTRKNSTHSFWDMFKQKKWCFLQVFLSFSLFLSLFTFCGLKQIVSAGFLFLFFYFQGNFKLKSVTLQYLILQNYFCQIHHLTVF